MDSFFTKHRKEVQKLCEIVANEISEKFNLDKDEIIAHLDVTMFKKPIRGRCEGYTKGSHTQCVLTALENERFCRRHMWSAPVSNPPPAEYEHTRCNGINKNGTQCMVRATVDGQCCKKHMFQNTSYEVEHEPMKCIHFELDEEGQEDFVCDHFALPDKWCCQKHKSMNVLYTQLLKSSSPSIYMTAVELGKRKKNDMIVGRIMQTA